MEIKKVSELPVLNQADFPSLPEVPAGKTIVSMETEWQNAEKEFAAGCLIMVCIRDRQWRAVRGDEMEELVRKHPLIFPQIRLAVVHALYALVDDGFVAIVQNNDQNCFIPTPGLGKTFFEGKTGLMEQRP